MKPSPLLLELARLLAIRPPLAMDAIAARLGCSRALVDLLSRGDLVRALP